METQTSAPPAGLALAGMYYTTPETIGSHDFSTDPADVASGNKAYTSEERKVETATDQAPVTAGSTIPGTAV